MEPGQVGQTSEIMIIPCGGAERERDAEHGGVVGLELEGMTGATRHLWCMSTTLTRRWCVVTQSLDRTDEDDIDEGDLRSGLSQLCNIAAQTKPKRPNLVSARRKCKDRLRLKWWLERGRARSRHSIAAAGADLIIQGNDGRVGK